MIMVCRRIDVYLVQSVILLPWVSGCRREGESSDLVCHSFIFKYHFIFLSSFLAVAANSQHSIDLNLPSLPKTPMGFSTSYFLEKQLASSSTNTTTTATTTTNTTNRSLLTGAVNTTSDAAYLVEGDLSNDTTTSAATAAADACILPRCDSGYNSFDFSSASFAADDDYVGPWMELLKNESVEVG